VNVVTAHLVYFRASSCSEIFPKNDGIRVGRRQFHAGVNALKGREEGDTFGNKRRASRIASSTEQDDPTAMLYLNNIRGSRVVK